MNQHHFEPRLEDVAMLGDAVLVWRDVEKSIQTIEDVANLALVESRPNAYHVYASGPEAQAKPGDVIAFALDGWWATCLTLTVRCPDGRLRECMLIPGKFHGTTPSVAAIVGHVPLPFTVRRPALQ